MTAPEGLTSFQVTVARLFFELTQSEGFLLAGGAALLAQQLTTRPTQDLDFFASPGHGDIPAARNALESAAKARGWQVARIRDSATFCRLVVRGPENLVVDLALDAAPNLPPTLTFLGPTFDREELAGRKVVALFDRAEARDFTDVYALSATYPKDFLLTRAASRTLASTPRCSGRCSPRCPASETGTCRSPSPRSAHCAASSQLGPPS
ncbi:nucleotidyl transferase AbiEii/AbiGii toxin family protein [Amycolatopsis circi]|uniref:nucleotidyl transferase AbiEii/AbiGii toxin family protein n=1 Tax=Amycolatopsis circi TaxID=871959 RepID=UPI000E263B1C|nr:nucleotidyl transferase AbiEii/AbiGii toxin family protein [Amycolatopsis circi]